MLVSDLLMLAAAVVVVVLLLVVVLVVVRQPRSQADASAAIQSLNQTLQAQQTQLAVLGEKLAHLEPVTQNISTSLNTQLGEVKQNLGALQAHVQARLEVEQRTSASVSRLEAVIAGTQTKGSAGENVVEQVFAKLPPEWQERGFTVKGKQVEFAFRLPNGLVVPIDSKWPATNLIEQFVAAEDPEAQKRLKADIEHAIRLKVKEVSKYVDPSVTMPFGIAVVPDAVYDLSGAVQAEAFKSNVVLVSYSTFWPYLLLVYQTAVKAGRQIDFQKLDSFLKQVEAGMDALREELDGRFSRALTMLGNARDDMHAQIGTARGALTSLQLGAAAVRALPESDDQESKDRTRG
jgi:DNA recombination protein RmuC